MDGPLVVISAMATPATTPVAVGHTKARLRLGNEARRQAISGPMPVSAINIKKIGTLTRLKNGGPTAILTPRTASVSTGNIVPQRIAKQATTRTRLLNRNDDSRDSTDSRWLALRSCGRRYTTKLMLTASIIARKAANIGPRFETVNACTEETMPDRVRKVPKMQSAYVAMMSSTFHTRSICFFSSIITECR